MTYRGYSPALAGLRVDTNDGLVSAADVGRVDREIRERPDLIALGFSGMLSLETLFDGVLMATGERRKDKVTGVWVTGVDGKTGAFSNSVDNREEITEINLWLDTLRVQVEREGHEIDVACAFTVSKDSSFDTISAGKQTKLRRRHGTA